MTTPYSETQLSSELFDQPSCHVRAKVFICDTGRTGSYLLSRAMIHHGIGVPLEYFNPYVIGIMAPRLNIHELAYGRQLQSDSATRQAYIDAIMERRICNGVFAAKIHWGQYAAYLDNPEGVGLLNQAHFIHLYREDLLAQAISLHVAIETGRWGGDAEVTTPPASVPRFLDTDLIARRMKYLAETDMSWRLFFARNAISPLTLSYERVKDDLAGALRTIVDTFGLDVPTTHFDYIEEGPSDARDAQVPPRSEIKARFLLAHQRVTSAHRANRCGLIMPGKAERGSERARTGVDTAPATAQVIHRPTAEARVARAMASDRSMTGKMLCLNMIVKNEAANLVRCLDAVAPHIACWVIGDTGSTDGTQDLITGYFAERGIPGELHSFPFADFEQARNEALARAAASPLAYDYLLLLDADMELVIEAPAFRERLDAAAYRVLQRDSIAYWNIRLLRRGTPARYRGVTHEYLDVGEESEPLAGVWFKDHASGANRVGKYARDIGLLTAAVEQEPENARHRFYLAQSLRDAGRTAEAAEAYAQRAEMGGWAEEAWYARLQEARCLLRLGDEAGFLRAAEAAFLARPQRAEPLYDLARYYRQNGDHERCVAIALRGLAVPFPAEDTLFLEEEAYRDGFYEELSISGFYPHDVVYREHGFAACNRLALSRGVRPAMRDLARANLHFYLTEAGAMLPSFAARPIEFTAPEGYLPMNPSVTRRGGRILLVQRVVNYVLDTAMPDEEPRRYRAPGGRVHSRNFLLSLNEDLEVESEAEILLPADLPPPAFREITGFEDLRPFVWRDALWCSASVCELDPVGRCQVVVARIDRVAPDLCRLAEWRLLEPEYGQDHEKNWMPWVSDEHLAFVYRCDPTRLVDETGRHLAETTPPIAADHFRGGSQAIPFDEGRLALIHETGFRERRRHYAHRFVWLDEAGRLRRVSRPFFFHERGGVEFAAGLAWHPDARRLIISYGIADRESRIATVEAEDVRRVLEDAEALDVSAPAPDSAPARVVSAAVAPRPPRRKLAPSGAPPIFIHASFRTSSTWFWSKFRALPGTCCYFEPFQRALSIATPSDVRTIGSETWDSRHPATDPYYLEYAPLIRKSGGVRLFKREFSSEFFIPQGGLRGSLRRDELRYLAILLRHAERSGSRAVFKFARSLGRISAIKRSLGGLHLFLHRNLWHHWLSYLHYKRRGRPWFYESIFEIVDRTDDAYFAYLSRHYRERARVSAGGDAPGGPTSAHDRLRSLPEPEAFALFMGLHVYLYLHAELAADLTIDMTRLASDTGYRAAIEQDLAGRTGLPIALADAHDPKPTDDAGFEIDAVRWEEIGEHARRAVASLVPFSDAGRLAERAHALIVSARQAMERSDRSAATPPAMTPRQTICLSMIVRDETAVIARCLASVRPLIDCWVIVDTGSTDGTQDLVRTIMAGIPGELHERPWVDFAHNRSEALALARPHGDYSLIIDADDTLEMAPGFVLPPLTADLYNVTIESPPIRYHRAQLVRNDKPWRYEGVLHEFLTCPAAGPQGYLPGLTIRRGLDGARRRDPELYRRDAAILEAALAGESDPFLVSRYRFYLAQSCQDCGETAKALENYLLRATLGFWDEEVFVSLYRAGGLQLEAGEPADKVLETWERATAACPHRAEALHAASRLCRLAERFAEGYVFARRGLAIAEPEQGLFVESWIYRYGLLDELAVTAYWTGRHDECLAACDRLLSQRHLPQEMRERVAANAAAARAQLSRRAPATPRPERGRCAVVTPYHREPREQLERCIASVRDQTIPVDHILVADGYPDADIESLAKNRSEGSALRHLSLDRSHGDAGNTPRAIGALMAAAEAYGAVAFLDADVRLAPDHVALCLAAAAASGGCDYVIARRRLLRPDDSVLPVADEPVEQHVDTNCLFLLKGAYPLLSVWALMPPTLAVIGDRVFYHALRHAGLAAAATARPTVDYLCLWDAVYRAIGETPPGHKPNPDHAAIRDWIAARPAPERAAIERLIAAPLDRLYQPALWPPLILKAAQAPSVEEATLSRTA